MSKTCSKRFLLGFQSNVEAMKLSLQVIGGKSSVAIVVVVVVVVGHWLQMLQSWPGVNPLATCRAVL